MMKRRRKLLTLASVLLVAFLIEGGVAILAQFHPPMSVSVVAAGPFGPGYQAEFRLSAGLLPIGALVALVPGTARLSASSDLFYFDDPLFPPLYGSPIDVADTGDRLGIYFDDMHVPVAVQFVDSHSVLEELATHPRSVFVVAAVGVIPDWLYSNSSDFLRNWIVGGGTLIWAGGPLAFSEGRPGPSGRLVYDSLNWEGQTRLLGFNLTDPSSTPSPVTDFVPPPSGNTQSTLSQALGISYSGITTGANVSELARHRCFSLGFEGSLPGASFTSGARTSLAYIPLGNGSIYYFGGGIVYPEQAQLAQASVEISQDISTLVGSGYRPAPGVPASVTIELPSLGSSTVILSMATRSAGVVGFVRSQIQGTYQYFWAEEMYNASSPLVLGNARG
jgi:hypothetical protein